MNLEFLISSCHKLIKGNHTDLLRVILQNNSELLLHPNNSGQTGLELMRTAENFNRNEIVKILDEHRANFDDPLNMAIYRAIYCGDIKSFELLLKNGSNLENPERIMEQIFSMKTMDSRKVIVKLILEYGQVDIANFKNCRGQNLLHILCNHAQTDDEGAVEMAEIIFNCGVSIDEVDNLEFTPLLRSIFFGNVPLISLLIKEGANVNYRSEKMGRCPLHEACFEYIIYEKEKILKLLLLNGADVNAKDKSGRTVLHRALNSKKQELVSLFLKYEADISALDSDGKTPFVLLKQNLTHFSNDNIVQSKTIMIKEFAKLIFENKCVLKMDMDSIQSDPEDREIFSKCLNELHQMSSTKFYGFYSLYSVLNMSKSLRKLANLMKNNEFVLKFEACNFHAFPYFRNDFQEIFKEAVLARDESCMVYLKLNSIFRDFLPDVVIRKLADNFTAVDLYDLNI